MDMKPVNDAIRAQLPAEVGDLLRERLDTLEELEKEVPRLRDAFEISQSALKKLQAQHTAGRDLAVERSQLDAKGRDLDLRDALLKLREEHAGEKVALMRALVEQVFRSRTFTTHATTPISVVATDYDGRRTDYVQHETSQTEVTET